VFVSLDPRDGAHLVVEGTKAELDMLAFALVEASDKGESRGSLVMPDGRREPVLIRRV
jgi:hypothetical protein